MNRLERNQESSSIYNSLKNNPLVINLAMETNYLYNKDYRTFKKKIEGKTRKWEDLPCLWISRINNMKMATMQKVVYRFKCISHQHSNVILCRN
jgi:hypothetical protein